MSRPTDPFPKWADIEASPRFGEADPSKKVSILDAWSEEAKKRIGPTWSDEKHAEKRKEILGRVVQFDLDKVSQAAAIIAQQEPTKSQRFFQGDGKGDAIRPGFEPWDKFDPRPLPEIADEDKLSPFARMTGIGKDGEIQRYNEDPIRVKETQLRKAYADLADEYQDPDVRRNFLESADKLAKLSRNQIQGAVVNGRIAVTPDNQLDENKFRSAINSIPEATPAMKQSALADFAANREATGERMAQALRKNTSDFSTFEAQGDFASSADAVNAYRDKIGDVGAFARAVGSGVKDSFMGTLIQPAIGLAAGASSAVDNVVSGKPSDTTKSLLATADKIGEGLEEASQYREALGVKSTPVIGDPGDFVATSSSVVIPLLAGGVVAGGTRAVAGRQLANALTARNPSGFSGAGIANPAIQAQAARTILPKIVSEAGFKTSVGVSAMQSYGGTFIDAYEANMDQNMKAGAGVMSEDEMMQDALNRAQLPAVASGVSTAIVTSAFGKTGVDALFSAAKTKSFKSRLGKYLKEAGMEATEEGIDQFVQGMVGIASYRPEATLGDIVGESVQAAVYGGLLGGGVNVARDGIQKFASVLLKRRADQAEQTGSPMTASVLREKSETVGEEVDKDILAKTIEAANTALDSIETAQETKPASSTPSTPSTPTLTIERPDEEQRGAVQQKLMQNQPLSPEEQKIVEQDKQWVSEVQKLPSNATDLSDADTFKVWSAARDNVNADGLIQRTPEALQGVQELHEALVNLGDTAQAERLAEFVGYTMPLEESPEQILEGLKQDFAQNPQDYTAEPTVELATQISEENVATNKAVEDLKATLGKAGLDAVEEGLKAKDDEPEATPPVVAPQPASVEPEVSPTVIPAEPVAGPEVSNLLTPETPVAPAPVTETAPVVTPETPAVPVSETVLEENSTNNSFETGPASSTEVATVTEPGGTTIETQPETPTEILNETQQPLSNQGDQNEQQANQPEQTEQLGGPTDTVPETPAGVEAGGSVIQIARPNAAPNPEVQDGADEYNKEYGNGEIVRGHYAPVDEDRAKSIAEAYEALPVLDNSPETQEAYAALATEVQQQWDFAEQKLGITFEAWTQEGQPYANSREMVEDVRENKHLYFFQGGQPHPLLNQPDENGLTINDKLRAIHDLFGHAAEDYQFGARGEENAWIKHSQMFSELAQKALTTETRGQNSWVNFGPQNFDENGERLDIPASERPFAVQKVALLPEEFMDWKGPLSTSPTAPPAEIPAATEPDKTATEPANVATEPDKMGTEPDKMPGVLNPEAPTTGEIDALLNKGFFVRQPDGRVEVAPELVDSLPSDQVRELAKVAIAYNENPQNLVSDPSFTGAIEGLDSNKQELIAERTAQFLEQESKRAGNQITGEDAPRLTFQDAVNSLLAQAQAMPRTRKILDSNPELTEDEKQTIATNLFLEIAGSKWFDPESASLNTAFTQRFPDRLSNFVTRDKAFLDRKSTPSLDEETDSGITKGDKISQADIQPSGETTSPSRTKKEAKQTASEVRKDSRRLLTQALENKSPAYKEAVRMLLAEDDKLSALVGQERGAAVQKRKPVTPEEAAEAQTILAERREELKDFVTEAVAKSSLLNTGETIPLTRELVMDVADNLMRGGVNSTRAIDNAATASGVNRDVVRKVKSWLLGVADFATDKDFPVKPFKPASNDKDAVERTAEDNYDLIEKGWADRFVGVGQTVPRGFLEPDYNASNAKDLVDIKAGNKVRIVFAKEVADAKERLKPLLQAPPVGELSPDNYRDLVTVGLDLVRKGATKLADFTRRLVAEVGQWAKSLAKRVFDDAIQLNAASPNAADSWATAVANAAAINKASTNVSGESYANILKALGVPKSVLDVLSTQQDTRSANKTYSLVTKLLNEPDDFSTRLLLKLDRPSANVTSLIEDIKQWRETNYFLNLARALDTEIVLRVRPPDPNDPADTSKTSMNVAGRSGEIKFITFNPTQIFMGLAKTGRAEDADYLRRMTNRALTEELLHAAHYKFLSDQYNKLPAATRRNLPFDQFATQAARRIVGQMDTVVKALEDDTNPNKAKREAANKAAQQIRQALADSINLYSATGNEVTAKGVFKYLNTYAGGAGQRVAVAEFIRQVAMLKQSGILTEEFLYNVEAPAGQGTFETIRRAIASMIRWFKSAVARMDEAVNAIDEGKFGGALKEEVEATVENFKAASEMATAVERIDGGVERGINIEVAPDPDNIAETKKWSKLSDAQKQDLTQALAEKVLPELLRDLELRGTIQFEQGGYENAINPSVYVAFGPEVTASEMERFAVLAGSVFQQKSVMVFDESITSGDGLSSHFVVQPSKSLSDKELAKFYGVVADEFPEASGFSSRGGNLVFSNFSGIDDKQFGLNLEDAVAAASRALRIQSEVVPTRFQSALLEDLKDKAKQTDYGRDTTTARTQQRRDQLPETKAGGNLSRRAGGYSGVTDLFKQSLNEAVEQLQGKGARKVRQDASGGSGGAIQLGIAEREGGLSKAKTGTFQLFKDKWVNLTHWSGRDNLKQTDPKSYGSYGAGKESARRRDYKKEWVDRTFAAYGKYTREPVIGRNRYTLRVDGNAIYDFNRDPDDLFPTREELRKRGYAPFDEAAANTIYEKKIKEAGYSGFVNSRLNVVALFDKAPATRIADSDKAARLSSATPEATVEPPPPSLSGKQLTVKEGEDHLVAEIKRQVGDNADIVVEDSTKNRGGTSSAFVEHDANGRPTVYISREHIDRLIKGRTQAAATAALTKIADEEVDHIATVKAVGWAKIQDIAERLGITEREAVARTYLSRGNFDTDAAYEDAVKRWAGTAEGMTAEERSLALKNLGAEFLRQVGQKARSGETTEDTYRHFNDKDFISTVLNYLAKLVKQIQARLQIGFDPELQQTIESINAVRRELAALPAVEKQALAELEASNINRNQAKQLLNFSESQTPQTFGDRERKTTRSLLRAILAQNDDVAKRLSEKTYIPDYYDEDNYVAESYVRSLMDQDPESVADKLKGMRPPEGMTMVQFILAKAQFARKLFNTAVTLQEEAFKGGSTAKLEVVRYLKDVREDLMNDLSEIATLYGQGLRAFKEVADQLDPYGAIRALNGGIRKVHKEVIGSDASMRALFARIQNAVESGSDEALKDVSDLLNKLVVNTSKGTVKQKKLLMELLKALYEIYNDKTLTRSRKSEASVPVMERYVQDLSKKISNLLLADSNQAQSGPVLAIVANEIRGVVQTAIKKELKRVTEEELKKKFTEEELEMALQQSKDGQAQKILDKLSQAILSRPWAERMFEETRSKILRDIEKRREDNKSVPLTDAQIEALEEMKLGNVLIDDNLMKVVRDAYDFRAEIRKHVLSQEASEYTLVNLFQSKFNISPKVAEAVAEAIRVAYKRNVKAAIDAEIKRTVASANAPEKEKKVANSAMQDLLELANMGTFSNEAFYNAVAKQFKLPQYDKEFSRKVEKEADRIQRMPDKSDARAEAAKQLLTQISKKHTDTLKKQDIRAWAKLYFMDVPLAVWQAGVLSGVPTQLVNVSMSNLHILMRSLSSAAGYAWADKNASLGDRSLYFADAVVGYLGALGMFSEEGMPNAVKTAFRKGMTTGSTRFRNEKADEFGVLEKVDIKALTFHKYVGRVMVAADAGNAAIASEVKSRMALRYALSTGQLKANREAFEELLNPSESAIQSVRRQAEQEAKAGLFDPSELTLAGIKGDARKAQIEKLRDVGIQNRMVELLEQRRFEVMPDLKRQARGTAEGWTFNAQAKGILGQVLSGLIGEMNRRVGVTRFVFSFMNTLANLLNAALDFSPVGIFRAYGLTPSAILPSDSVYRWDVDENGNKRPIEPGSPEFYEKVFMGISGSLAYLALTLMVLKGFEDEEEGEEPWFAVYGEGPTDKAQRQQLEAAGWQPSTVKFGSLRLRFTDLPLVNLPLSIFGTISDVYRYEKGGEKTAGDRAWAAAVGAFSSITSKSLFAGASNFFKIFTGDPNQTQSGLKQITSGIVGGYTNPSMLRWIRSTFAMGEDGMVNKLDYSTTEGWLYSMVPLSLGYNKAAIDYRGNEIKDYPWTATTRRFGVIEPRPLNEADTKLVTAGLRLTGPSKTTEIVLPKKDGTTVQIPVGRYADVWRAFQKYRGEYVDRIVTDELASKLATAAQKDRDAVQTALSSELGPDANAYAKAKVQKDIANGRLQVPIE